MNDVDIAAMRICKIIGLRELDEDKQLSILEQLYDFHLFAYKQGYKDATDKQKQTREQRTKELLIERTVSGVLPPLRCFMCGRKVNHWNARSIQTGSRNLICYACCEKWVSNEYKG